MSAGTTEYVIERGRRLRLRVALRELWPYRGTVVAFAERDIRVKYKQAILGVAWAVIQPLTYMVVFSLTLGRLASVGSEGLPYAVFVLAALVPWTFLQTAVSFGSNALLTDGALVRKIYFPREVPVLGAIVSAGVDLAIGIVLFFLIGPFLGAHITAWWLLAPFLAIPLAALAAGVSLLLGALNVYYRDFRYALPFALQLWLFASPVVYSLYAVSPMWRPYYVALNPAAGILDSFRRTLAHGVAPSPTLLAASIAGSLVFLVVGYRVFKGLEPNFADVV